MPLDWAVTQNNRGTGFVRLGERESGASHLELSVVRLAPRGVTTQFPLKLGNGRDRFLLGAGAAVPTVF